MREERGAGFNLRDKLTINVERKAKSGGDFGFTAIWRWRAYRRGLLLWEDKYKNKVVDEGLTYALGALKNGTPKPAWYVLLFESNHAPAEGDTYANPGFTECTAYDEATRPLWNAGSIIDKVLSNGLSLASYTMSATNIIYGGALVSDARKGVPGAAVVWQTEHPYNLDQIVVPVGSPAPPYSPNGHYYKCTVPGTSGVSEPAWPPASPADGTVTDGEVTWQDMGIVADQIMFSSGTFDVPKPAEADDIIKISIEIIANAVVV